MVSFYGRNIYIDANNTLLYGRRLESTEDIAKGLDQENTSQNKYIVIQK